MQQLTDIIVSVFVFPLSQSRSPLETGSLSELPALPGAGKAGVLGAFGDEGKDFRVPPT